MALYAFDGTWDTPDARITSVISVARGGRVYEPRAPTDSENTNVVLFGRHYDPEWSTDAKLLKRTARDRESFYVKGVGTRFSLLGRGIGGMFGAGGKRRVRMMYGYLCERYPHDPVIDLVGFSRGAATAVHFTNALHEWGICDARAKRWFPWWDRHLGWTRFRKRTRDTNADPHVRFLGLFDEVATFAVPIRPFRNRVSPTWKVKHLPPLVQRCFHAMALDEVRRSFELIDPEPMDRDTETYSLWFRGVHRNIGGGHLDRGLSDIALVWMLEMLSYAMERSAPAILNHPDPPCESLVRRAPVYEALERLDAARDLDASLDAGVAPFQPDANGFIPRKRSTSRTSWREVVGPWADDARTKRKAPKVHHTATVRASNASTDFYGDNQSLLARIPSDAEIVYDAPLLALNPPSPIEESLDIARSAFRALPIRPRSWMMIGDQYLYRGDHWLAVGSFESRYHKKKAKRAPIAVQAYLEIIMSWLLAHEPEEFTLEQLGRRPRSMARRGSARLYAEYPEMTDDEVSDAIEICLDAFRRCRHDRPSAIAAHASADQRPEQAEEAPPAKDLSVDNKAVPSATSDEDQSAGNLAASKDGVDAIVFVSGLELGKRSNRTFEGVVERIVRACDRQHPSPGRSFTVEDHPVDLGGSNGIGARKALFVTGEDDTALHHADLFEFNWSPDLIERWENLTSRARVTKGILGFIIGLKLFLFAALRLARRQTFRRAAQAAIAFLALATVTFYLAGLLAGAITALVQWFSDAAGGLDIINQVVVVITAALTFLLPGFRSRIPAAAAALLAAASYVSGSEEPSRLAGRLVATLETIEESGMYERIHVVAYSMGGIVALDTIFPSNEPVRSVRDIDTLITIAPPFEVVRAASSSFFDDRHSAEPTPRWINYWCESDVLSSDAPRPKNQTTSPLGGKNMPEPKTYNLPVRLTFARLFSFAGLASHSLYWGDDGVDDVNVFDQIVVDLGLNTDTNPRGPAATIQPQDTQATSR